jgi:hypothetical protein
MMLEIAEREPILDAPGISGKLSGATKWLGAEAGYTAGLIGGGLNYAYDSLMGPVGRLLDDYDPNNAINNTLMQFSAMYPGLGQLFAAGALELRASLTASAQRSAALLNAFRKAEPLSGAGLALDAGNAAERARVVRLGNLPRRIKGSTDKFGNITIQRGLSMMERRLTLRHEMVHRFFSPRPGSFLAEARANVGMWAYNNLDLVRYTEEALAEGYSLRSLSKGVRYPLAGGYSLTNYRLAIEAGLFLGVSLGPAAVALWRD